MAKDQAKAMRAANWAAQVDALRDGRKQRAGVVPSKKAYRRDHRSKRVEY